MSPRRRIEPGSNDERVIELSRKKRLIRDQDWRALLRRARGLPAVATAASLAVVAAIAVTGWMLSQHLTDRRAEVADAEVLGYVGQFMTDMTTLDPFHANDYADRILAQATGDFAKQYREKENATVVMVARAEPTKGTVLEAGIEKRHDDGSVSVLVATKMTTTAGDLKKPIVSGNRWVVTAVKEGQQWKISRLIPVL
jgi:Mce-associated membrane protein